MYSDVKADSVDNNKSEIKGVFHHCRSIRKHIKEGGNISKYPGSKAHQT